MATQVIRIGAIPDAFAYDDGDYSTAMETDQPIAAGAPAGPTHVVRLEDIPDLLKLEIQAADPIPVVADADLFAIVDTSENTLNQVTVGNLKAFLKTYFDSLYLMPYGEISAYEQNATITISASGVANKVQISTFNTNGPSYLTTPDHTTDDITIQAAGVYRISCDINTNSIAGPAATFGFAVCKNNGTILQNLHGHHDFAGGGAEEMSVSMNGLVTLAENDTIEVWVWNYTGTEDIIIDDITLSLNKIGN